MWKDYSSGYIKHNKASCISVMAAAFFSTLLLSLLCSLFYNIWQDEIRRIILEEGDWQGRITGTLTEADLVTIQILRMWIRRCETKRCRTDRPR